MKRSKNEPNLGSKSFCFKMLAKILEIIYYQHTILLYPMKIFQMIFYLFELPKSGKSLDFCFYRKTFEQTFAVLKLCPSTRNDVSLQASDCNFIKKWDPGRGVFLRILGNL